MIHSASHWEMVLLMNQVIVFCLSSNCGDFRLAGAGPLWCVFVPVLLWLLFTFCEVACE